MRSPVVPSRRYSRLGSTTTFRGDGLAKWLNAVIVVCGGGLLGQRLATETVLSGGRVVVYDFDSISAENCATQRGSVGARKVDVIIDAANAIQPGRAGGFCCDIRHAGVGDLVKADVLVDCTDDPALALPLTRISNGLGVPLLRPAVDGSGELEMGRVLCSHGGYGRSCQVCPYDLPAVLRHTNRTPCPGGVSDTPIPTLAGGALAMMVAGMALLQAQRLVTGNDLDQVIDRELIVNMSGSQLFSLERRRSDTCLSGHRRWSLTHLERGASETTFSGLFAESEHRLASSEVSIEPFGHPICTEVACACGESRQATGTQWAPTRSCPGCGVPMQWVKETWRDRLRRGDVEQFADTPLSDLGLPTSGAMFVARSIGKYPLRLVLGPI